MSFGIEMGTVPGMLEVFLTEFGILNLDTARCGSVEEGEAMTLAGLLNGTNYNGKAFTRQVPWRNDGNLGMRILLAKSYVEIFKVSRKGTRESALCFIKLASLCPATTST